MGKTTRRQHPGDIVDKATACHMHQAIDFVTAQNIDHTVHIDSGWHEQFLAHGAAKFFNMIVHVFTGFFKKDLTGQGVAV